LGLEPEHQQNIMVIMKEVFSLALGRFIHCSWLKLIESHQESMSMNNNEEEEEIEEEEEKEEKTLRVQFSMKLWKLLRYFFVKINLIIPKGVH